MKRAVLDKYIPNANDDENGSLNSDAGNDLV
jgi:hypothetical protein